jgi:L-fuconolactonase
MLRSGVRIDAHQHFWHYDPVHHGWMTEAMGTLKRDWLPADLAPHLRAVGIDGTVTVQARQVAEETTFLLQLADAHPTIIGVVGWVDLRHPDVADAIQTLAAQPKLVGVRHVVHDEPDDDFLLRRDVRHGIGQLRAFGLAYDLLLFPRHLPRAVRLVEEFPDQPFVLDHLAKPRIGEGLIEPWATDLRRLAACPNVTCKLSGMVTEARWDAWTPDQLRPYLDIAVEAFGADRLMMGSDWPVCTLAADYAQTVGVVMDYVQGLGPEAAAAILGGTAARVYGL